MTLRKILITINAGATECGSCKYCFRSNWGPDFCDMYMREPDAPFRLPECLEAEALARIDKDTQ